MNDYGWASLGLQFGLAVYLPFLWICAATLPLGGLMRFREFWRYYELHYRIGLGFIACCYIPIGLLGV